MTVLRQLLLGALLSTASFQTVSAATAPSLGTATSFAVLGGSAVTNTGPTVINGNLGVSPGSAVSGFPPGTVVPPGTIHAADAVAAGAQLDNTAAYNALAAQACNTNLTGQDLGGLTLTPGVYCFSASAQLTGTLTLNAQGNANAVFIFQIGGTLTTAGNSSVNIINGGSACNVFWQVGSSANLGPTTSFIGNVLALTNIAVNTGARLSGRVLAQNGAVTLDSNIISITDCNASFIAPPTITKAFGAAAIGVGGTTTLSFTLSNPNAVPLTGVAFTDTLPAGLVVSVPNGLTGSCDAGIVTAAAGSGTVSLAGATLAAGASCTFSVNVTGTTLGVKNNSVTVTSTNGGTGNTSMTSLAVLATSPIPAPPTIAKAYGASVIVVGGTTALSFTITNPNAGPLTGVAFTDTLPAGWIVSTPNGLTGTCDAGTIIAVAGSGTVSLAGATLAGGASCTFSVNVTGTTEGVKNNNVTVTSTNGGTGNTSTTSVLALAAPPAFSKSFGTAVIPLGGTTALSFTIGNPNATVALTGVGFVDTLPAGLVVATPNGLTGSCGGSVITAPAGSGSITLSGATLAAGASCTFSVNVTGTSLGVLTNVTGNTTSTNGGPGNTASATIAVGVFSLTATAGTPQSAMIGTAFGTPLQATVRDSSNAPAPGVMVTFTAPALGASGTFAGGVTTVKASTNAAGVATAPAFTANGTPGVYIVNASVPGIGTPATFNLVNTGPPASITSSAETPQSATVGTAFATALQATVRDAGDNPLSGVTVTFTAPASGASGTFSGSGTTATAVTNAAGVATAPTFTANTIAASYTVNATVVGVISPAPFNLTNVPGATALVTAVSGSPQSATVNTAFANPFVVNVKDAFGNLVPGASVTFVAPGSGPSGKFVTTGTITATLTTNALGIATSPVFTANVIAGGPYNVAASSTGNPSTAFFALTNNNIVSTSTLLTASPNPSTLSQPVTLTATVAPSGATGKATFSFGTMLIGTAALNASGQATLTTRLLPSGTAPLRATYTGDSTHASSTSGAVSQTVKALAATSFAPLVNFAAGTGPYAMALGDFNGDGIADLAIANQSSSNLTVLLGNGSGGFVPAPGSPIALGNFPGSVSQGSVAVGDFNGDGNADLIVSNRADGTVKVLIGDGAGGFTLAGPVAALAPGSLAVADFNGDGLADFAVVNIVGPANTITVFLGNGNGGFTAASGSLTADANALSLVAGDFNGDGHADLAVANNTSNSVTVLLGNGNGVFAAAPGNPIATGANPVSLAVGNFNGDGFADLAVVNGGSVTVLLGSAAGAFTQPAGSPSTIPGVSGNNSVAAGDFNGDGISDLAVTGTGGQVVVMSGNGSGGFTPSAANPFPVGTQPLGIVAGDFNRDGKTDLAVANFTSNNVSVLLGIGPPASVTATAGTPQSTIAGTAFATALQATVRDAGNNLLSGVTVTFTAPASRASGTFAGDGNTATANTNASGVATAPAFTANCAVGPYTVTAMVAGVATVANFSLTNTIALPSSISVTSGSGQSAFVNTAFGSPLVATVRDACANPVPNASVTFTAPVSGASAKFSTTGTNSATVSTDASGVAASPALTANATAGGPYGVTAAAPGVATPISFTLTNTAQPVLSTAPTLLSFSYQIGANVPAAQLLAVTSSGGSVSFTAAASVVGGTWLSVNPASGSTPASLSVSVDPTGLAAGTYNKTVVITSAGASNSPLSVPVTLTVTQQPVLSTAPTSLSFISQVGASPPPAQLLAVTSGGSSVSFTAAASAAGGTWLSVNPASGSTPSSLSVSVDPTGLAAGTYNKTVVITSAGASNSPLTVLVTLTVAPPNVPDLTITKTHVGNFTQGQTGAIYTITATNLGTAATSGTVTVSDTVPAGLTAAAIAGTGWTCTQPSGSCTRNDALAAGASYPALTLTVNVAANAASSVTNTATVSGGGETNTSNDAANDLTTINPPNVPDLTITKTHMGNFAQGQTGATYTITATNSGTAATSGTVTVADTVPAGLTATAIAGAGWTCTQPSGPCTRADALGTGLSYPAITLTVNVAANAASSVTNTATVSGGGETNTSNDTASDLTTITPGTTTTTTTTVLPSSQNPSTLSQPVTLTATVTPSGATGKVTFSFGTMLVGTAPLNASEQATLTTRLLPSGTAPLRATYSGDSTHASSTSAPVSQTVKPLAATSFAPAAAYAAGTNPLSVEVGDFNGDGIPDLAVAGGGANGNVTVLLGNSSGGFNPGPGSPFSVAGPNPLSIAVGDFNGDGIADLAVAGNILTILLGTGSGGFTAGPSYAFNSVSVAAGDFNRDGIADLVVANPSGGVSVLLGDGNAGFTASPGSPFATGINPFSVAVGDFNGDGFPDLAVANAGSNNATVLLGNGSGGFTPAPGSPIGVGLVPLLLTVADFNGDGLSDLAVANDNATVAVLLGGASGAIAPAPGSPIAFGFGAVSLVAADFNGDGAVDLAVGAGSGGVILLLGNGGGGFTRSAAGPFPVPLDPRSLAVADFNGDGKPDLVAASTVDNTVSVLLAIGPPASVTATAGTPQSALAGTALATALQATVRDAGNNLLGGATVTFTAPASGASGTFAGGGTTATATTNASGVAAAPTFTANCTVGPYTVTTMVTGVATAANFSLTNAIGPPASIAATSGGGQSAMANAAFANPLVETVRDACGNPVPNASVTFTAPASGASATFAVTATNSATVTTNASGVATSPALTANSTLGGPYVVTATVPGVASSATFNLANIVGAPASITATTGTPQSAVVGNAFATALQATLRDAGNNPVSGATVTFTASASGPSGTFAGGGTTAAAVTNASGVATAPAFTANCTVGPYTVTALAVGVATAANFSLTNTVGPPAGIAPASGSGQSATVNAPFASPLAATVKDSCGNLVPNASVTFTAPTSGASATFVTTGANSATVPTNASGVATSPAFTANGTAGGPYNIAAVVSGVAGAATFSLTNAQVVPAISSLSPTTATAGIDFLLTVTGTGFAANATVNFNGQTLTPTSANSTQLIVTVPGTLTSAASPGPVPVTITSNGVSSPAATFTLTAPISGIATAGNIIITGHDDDFHASSAPLSIGETPSASAKAQLAAMVKFARAASQNPALPVLIFDQGTQLQEVLTSLGVPFDRRDPSAGVPDSTLFDVTKYSAVGVASDKSCGPCDNDDTSSANLAAARPLFQSFVAARGGIFAFAAAGSNTYYNFLPKPVVKFNLLQSTGFQSTPVGDRLGIPATNGNPGHDTFPQPGTGGVDPEWEIVETDAVNNIDTVTVMPVTLAIEGASFTTACPLPSGTVNVSYPALTLTETGLSGTVTWSGILPQGLGLSPGGVVSGIPSAAGSSNFTLTVTDGVRTTAKSCGITINNPLVLRGVCPSAVPVGVPVSIPLTASGGDGGYTLTYTSGPTWLSLSATTVTGTPPAPGVFPFTVTLMDRSGTPVATFTCSVTVLPALTLIGTCPATSIPVGTPFTLPLTASGGSGTYQLSLSGPSWLALSSTSGTAGTAGFAFTLNGTPPAGGTYPFTVTLTDSAGSLAKTFTCNIVVTNPLQLSGVCPATPVPQGVLFTLALAASGGNGNYRLVSSGPPWLALSNSSGTAVNGRFQTAFAGVPPVGGSFPFSITLSDTGGSAPVSLFCGNFAGLPQLVIVGACPAPLGTPSSTYVLPFSISGGNGNYLISSTTPVLSLSAGTGTALAGGTFNDSLTGIFTAPGIYPVSVQVSDTAGSRPALYTCNIVVNSPPVTVTITSGCPAGSVMQGTSYLQQLSATGGDGNFAWAVVGGSLPAGLSLIGSTISGIPTGPPGKSSFTIQVSSAAVVGQVSCSITVAPAALHLTSGCPGDGVQGSPYGPVVLSATGGLGAGTYTFSLIGGGLPAGLNLSNSTISGTPAGPPGVSSFQIQVTSGTQTDTTAACSLKIAPPAVGPLQLSAVCPATQFIQGLPVSLLVTASGGQPPYSFALTSGPPWLTVTNNGSSAIISGTAAATGTFGITVMVTDSAKSTTTYLCSIQVNPGPLQITAACPAAVTAGTTFTMMLSARGGGSAYTWNLDGPPWMTLTSATGANISLTATPPAAGTFPFTVTLSDNANSTPVALSCTLTVNPPRLQPLQITPTTGCPAAPIAFGSMVSVALSGSGGQMPYAWSLNGPPWLRLNSPTGTNVTVTGNAGAPAGTVSFTVSLDDSAGSGTANFSCTLTINFAVIPPITITGLAPTPKLTDPVPVNVALAAPALVPIEVDLRLLFTPNAFGLTDNPQVTFLDPRATNGGRLLHFLVPAGTQTVPLVNIMQGTVAGTIRVEVISLRDGDRDVLPANHPFSELVIPRSPPIITGDISFANESPNGFDVLISGYSTPRDMTSVELTFTAAQDATIEGSATFTVQVNDIFTSFYQSARSAAGGSTFTGLRIPVSVEGDKTAIGSVTVTLTNSAGKSAAITKNR